MTQRILITGGTGFVGRVLVTYLVNAGYDITVVTRNAVKLNGQVALPVRVVEVSFEDTERLMPHLRETDVVLHVAAFIPQDMRDPQYAQPCLLTNAIGTLNLLQASRDAGVGQFIYYSSGNIYRFKPSPAHEDDPVYPVERAPFYLGSKVMGEIYVEHFRAAYGFKTIILRLSTVYGHGMKPTEVAARFFHKLGEHQPIELLNGGQQTADFLYVKDIARITEMVVTRQVSGIFNVGSGRAITILELANSIAEIMGASRDLITVRPITSDMPHAPGFAPLDVSHAAASLGWMPTPLVDGLKQWVQSANASM